MKVTTLCMTVGRGPKIPLVSVDDTTENGASIMEAHQQIALAEKIKAGNDPNRISFTEEVRDIPEPQPVDEGVTVTKRIRRKK